MTCWPMGPTCCSGAKHWIRSFHDEGQLRSTASVLRMVRVLGRIPWRAKSMAQAEEEVRVAVACVVASDHAVPLLERREQDNPASCVYACVHDHTRLLNVVIHSRSPLRSVIGRAARTRQRGTGTHRQLWQQLLCVQLQRVPAIVLPQGPCWHPLCLSFPHGSDIGLKSLGPSLPWSPVTS